ncbi:MAG: HK97 gp10 family phage protein [Oscillospiraceae bacterium]|nr:HK97 gp10 family phage protein [Oscillospiraceae bacterium]
MAKIEFKGIDEYSKKLAQLGVRAEGVCKYAVYDAAGLVIDAIKDACPADTGDLRDSIKLAHMQNQDGFIHTKIVFEGYDRKGRPNAVKARVIERGNSHQSAKPFVRPTVNRVRRVAEQMMGTKLDEKIYQYMNEDF